MVAPLDRLFPFSQHELHPDVFTSPFSTSSLYLSCLQAVSRHYEGCQSRSRRLTPVKAAKSGEKPSMVRLQLRSFLHQTPSTIPLDVRADRETSTLLRKQGESKAYHAHGSQTTENFAC